GGAAGLALAAATAWPWLQLASGTTVAQGRTWLAALDWFTFALVFLFAADVLANHAARLWFLRATVVGAALLAVVAVAQKSSANGAVYWMFPSGYDGDVLGPFVNRNQFAAWIELVLPIALFLAATDRKLRSLYALAAVAMFS